jgi:hypothetical protein
MTKKTMTKSTKKQIANNVKIDEFIRYSMGISLLFLTGSILLLSYAAILQMKQMGK